jgi:PAS domain S-box-containing protein
VPSPFASPQVRPVEAPSADLQGRLAGILSALPDAVLCIDRSWHITYANPEAIRLSRLEPEHFAERDFWQIFPAVLATELERRYRVAMASGRGDRFDYYYPPYDHWVEITVLPTDEGFAAVYRDVSERKRSDRRQAEAAQHIRHIFEAMPDSVVTVDGDYRFSFANQPAMELCGRDDLVGHNIFDLFPGNLEEPFQSTYRTAMEKRLPGEFEAYHPAPLNKWVRVMAKPFENGIVIFFSDITARRLQEQELAASEARYRVLADLNPLAIWMGDAQGNVTYANRRALAYLGLQPETLSRGWLGAFAPGDRERVIEQWAHALAAGEEFEMEALLRHAATGEYRYWQLSAAPIRGAGGAILHWLGVGQDIHDAKTYTAALRSQQMEAEKRRAEIESIYATSPVGLALLDPVDFTFLNLNEQEAEMLGWPRETLIGRPLGEIAPPDKLPGLMELMHSVAAGATVRHQLLEGELAARPGEKRAWSVNYAPIFNEDGTVRAISTASLEITHQKKAEAALIQSEKLAAVGRLASSISHEINNPLEAITNLLYLMGLEDDLPDGIRNYVSLAQSELGRVSQIATQTLRFHRQAVAPTLVTAADLVEAVIRLYTGRLANSHIKVEAQYRTVTQILCFENDIRQVLNNLIANAIDAMRMGGRMVIRANATSVPRPGVRLSIADNGHGMSAAVAARIFEPFFTTKDLNGTGLGLWISAGIMERHQGTIRVRSSEREGRQGTVFTIFLPCEEKHGK